MNKNQLWRIVTAMCLVSAFAFNGMQPAHGADGPIVIKPRVFMKVWQSWHAWSPTTKKFQDNTTSWMPDLKFTVEGPVPAGSQFSVDFTKPNGALWWSLDCPTDEIPAGEWSTLTTPHEASTAAEKKYTTGVGVFGFKIRLKNELTGQNKVLFTGKFKISKNSNYNGTPITKNQYDYYVDHDWALPIGYIYSKSDSVMPPLGASMWFKGDTNGSDLAGYIFYNGKQIGSTKEQGSFSTTEAEMNTVSNDKDDPTWKLWAMEWYNVATVPTDPDNPNERVLYLSKNPGNYEIKVLRRGKLCRQAKFTVGADGKIVDNGFVSNNKLGTDRMLLPVKVLGTTDGTWQKMAWQTQAFYGNPLKGFVAP